MTKRKRNEPDDEIDFEYMFRSDDNTVAYFCPEEHRVVCFVDLTAFESRDVWFIWGRRITRNYLKFLIAYIQMVDLHEAIHAFGGVVSSEQCDYGAISVVWSQKWAERIFNHEE